MHTLPSQLRYSLSWPPQQITLINVLIIPNHCCGVFHQSCTHHWEELTSFKLPYQLKCIPSAVHSVICGIFRIPYKRHNIASLFPSFIYNINLKLFSLLKGKILYLLIFMSPPHQDTLYQINSRDHPSSVPILFISLPSLTHCRPSSDLRSAQLLTPIIPHQQRKVHFVIRFYIYCVLYHPHIRIPYIRFIIVICHYQCLFLFIYLPPLPHNRH